jgi:hypothetical protein
MSSTKTASGGDIEHLTEAAEKYLGDTAFEALWAELDLRPGVVFEHPRPPLPPAPAIAWTAR